MDNKSVLAGELTPSAIMRLFYIAYFYSIWISLFIAVGSFVIVNGLILAYTEAKDRYS